jgi:hypothetical protein
MGDPAPRRRYMVTPNAMEARFTLMTALRRLVELNQDQQFSLNRDQLIEMLDAAIAEVEAGR